MHNVRDGKHQGTLIIEDDEVYWLNRQTNLYESQKINFCPYCGDDIRDENKLRCFHGLEECYICNLEDDDV